MSYWVAHYPIGSVGKFEPKAAVYVIYDRKLGLIYIGETTNMRARMQQHGFVLSRYSLTYRSVQFGFITDPTIKVKYARRLGQEAMWERRLIRSLQPSRNQRGITKAEAMPLQQANG